MSQLLSALPNVAFPDVTAGIKGTRIAPVSGFPTIIALPSRQLGAALILVELRAAEATLQATTHTTFAQINVASLDASALSSSQLQALPLNGRNWHNFALDSPAAEIEDRGKARTAASDDVPAPMSEQRDGIRLAFDSAGVSRRDADRTLLIGPGSGGSAIAEMRTENGNGTPIRRRRESGRCERRYVAWHEPSPWTGVSLRHGKMDSARATHSHNGSGRPRLHRSSRRPYSHRCLIPRAIRT